MEEANAYLEGEFLAEWEDHFTVEARNPTEAHRRLGGEHDLAAILSQVQTRVVTNDYTLRFDGRSYRIARRGSGQDCGARGAGGRSGDETLGVKFRDRYLTSRCAIRRSPKPQPWRTGEENLKSPHRTAKPRNWMERIQTAEESARVEGDRSRKRARGRPGQGKGSATLCGANSSRPTGSFR